MTVVEEQTPLQTEVQAETSYSAIRTAVPDASLFQSFLELPVPVVLLTLWLVGGSAHGCVRPDALRPVVDVAGDVSGGLSYREGPF